MPLAKEVSRFLNLGLTVGAEDHWWGPAAINLFDSVPICFCFAGSSGIIEQNNWKTRKRWIEVGLCCGWGRLARSRLPPLGCADNEDGAGYFFRKRRKLLLLKGKKTAQKTWCICHTVPGLRLKNSGTLQNQSPLYNNPAISEATAASLKKSSKTWKTEGDQTKENSFRPRVVVHSFKSDTTHTREVLDS